MRFQINSSLKKHILNCSFVASVACLFCFQLSAQNIKTNGKQTGLLIDTAYGKKHAEPSLKALAERKGDSIVLRWFPENIAVWAEGKRSGYLIKRYSLDEPLTKVTEEKILTREPLKPWSKQVYKDMLGKTRDTLLAASSEIVYNTSATMNGNGKSLSELVEKSSQQNMLHTYGQLVACLSPISARAMGLSFVDNDVEKNKNYVYSVYLAQTPDKKMKADTAMAIVSEKYNALLATKMSHINATCRNKMVEFSWDKMEQRNNFVAYFIERSDDGGKTFHQTNKLPLVETGETEKKTGLTNIAILRDSVPRYYVAYQYRISAINVFGDKSEPSNVVAIKAEYRNPPPMVFIKNIENTKDSLVKISWQVQDTSSALAGYLVGRSNAYDGFYKPLFLKLLPPNTTSFTDKSADPEDENFYVISSIDTSGNITNSLPRHVPMIDKTPPKPPKNLRGIVDSTGLVFLAWHKSDSKDVKGYIIQKENALNHTFTPISNGLVTDTVFVDSITLKTLSKHIYYRVIAYDKVSNSSDPSNIADLTKPDIVPPVAAVFTKYNASDTAIQLFWNPGSSSDLQKQYLYRKDGNQKSAAYKMIARLNAKDSMYVDSENLETNNNYCYRIIEVDSAGLKSDSSYSLCATLLYIAKKQELKFEAKYMADSNFIKIAWGQQNLKNIARIILYRSSNTNPMQLYASIPVTASVFIDKQVAANNIYWYSYKCVYTNNNESLLTGKVSVTTNKPTTQ